TRSYAETSELGGDAEPRWTSSIDLLVRCWTQGLVRVSTDPAERRHPAVLPGLPSSSGGRVYRFDGGAYKGARRTGGFAKMGARESKSAGRSYSGVESARRRLGSHLE